MATTLKALVNKRAPKEITFMGEKVNIYKLTLNDINALQEISKEAADDDEGNLKSMRAVIRMAVEGGDEISDDEFNNFPLEDLNKLSTEILKHSGIDPGKQTPAKS